MKSELGLEEGWDYSLEAVCLPHKHAAYVHPIFIPAPQINEQRNLEANPIFCLEATVYINVCGMCINGVPPGSLLLSHLLVPLLSMAVDVA